MRRFGVVAVSVVAVALVTGVAIAQMGGAMHGTMYSVELKGPNEELRIFHVNPWGNVMPFGGPGRRTG